MILVKFAGGTKWHHHTLPCTRKRQSLYKHVDVKSPWDSPVDGHTCIKCQPAITAELEATRA